MKGFSAKIREAWDTCVVTAGSRQADSILIVDDNPENIHRLAGMLSGDGYEVEFASDSACALDWIGARKFDAILLDVRMPVMNGFEISARIRKSEINSETPVIMLTALNDLKSFSMGFDSGGSDYITRPFRKKELLARIRAKIDDGKAGKKLRQYVSDMESANRYIMNSLEYAAHIQNTILKSCEEKRESLPEHFVLSLPRDVISGDFHCFYRVGDKLTGVLMDSTGHGVPGALMSILGVTLCNEVILREHVSRPDLILNRLRNKLLKALGEGRRPELIRDGMEGAVISYSATSHMLQYSGSFNPMFLVRRGELYEFRGDRISVGYCEASHDFTLQEIAAEPGDMVYLLTDGYTDQFGGEKGKKYMIKRLREFILSVHDQPVGIQRELFLENFQSWKGECEQTDDVLVLGLRL